MRILFVRHGETPWNADRIYQGWIDVPLNARGARQAAAAADALAARRDLTIRALYASPLRRAWVTAETIGTRLGLRPAPLPGLKELNWGEAAGLPFAEVARRWPDLAERRRLLGLAFETPGGESGWAFRARVVAAIEEVVTRHRAGSGADDAVVIVAHGGTIGFALAHLRGDDFATWPTVPLGNAAFCEVRLGMDGAPHEIVCVDERAHLVALDTGEPDDHEHV